jgi:hypothetical protein
MRASAAPLLASAAALHATLMGRPRLVSGDTAQFWSWRFTCFEGRVPAGRDKRPPCVCGEIACRQRKLTPPKCVYDLDCTEVLNWGADIWPQSMYRERGEEIIDSVFYSWGMPLAACQMRTISTVSLLDTIR